MVDVVGWTECLPLGVREAALVVAQNLVPWPVRGLDFDNDSAFMNDTVVSWCRSHDLEVIVPGPTRRGIRPSWSKRTELSFAARWAMGGLKALMPLAY
ncbi:hypothetical protein CQ12_30475 [Bradyrhizobium jicamae]|uniref:Uncharacterized protein n=2 Tax=Bradyrhizobium jicamae TaxID=280332 RepID=A0A0R3KLB3_9BRAD|nr:hypothetical protein CQ12_30475 [Bradyrhizobium jicamae]